MEFRSLTRQYNSLKNRIDYAIGEVIADSSFISGRQVKELESKLAEYVGVKHCISCANGTDALSLAMMTWGIGEGDAVFVPDFTFFSSGEIVSFAGATPIFVDVDYDTFNIDCEKLEKAIQNTFSEGKFTPRAVVAVDLFGQSANYSKIACICKKYNLLILEDGAQGFGGRIGDRKNCSFGDISTTSFFPMKPLGCYGDGGAVFTDNDEWASLIRSYCVHGKGSMKYDNVRIGVNSRLDTLQAAILLAKLDAFKDRELSNINDAALLYNKLFQNSNIGDKVTIPVILDGYISAWAQYTIKVRDKMTRDSLEEFLHEKGIPSFVYYPKPMHRQKAFSDMSECFEENDYSVTEKLCETVLSLPISPYIENNEIEEVVARIEEFFS